MMQRMCISRQDVGHSSIISAVLQRQEKDKHRGKIHELIGDRILVNCQPLVTQIYVNPPPEIAKYKPLSQSKLNFN